MSSTFMTAEAASEISAVCGSSDTQTACKPSVKSAEVFNFEHETVQILSSILAAVRDEALKGRYSAIRSIPWSAWDADVDGCFKCRPKDLVEATASRLSSLGYRYAIDSDEQGWTFRISW